MPGLMLGLVGGLFHGVSGGLIYCLSQGFKGTKIETKTLPNQGIWESARSAVFLGLMGGVIGGIKSEDVLIFLENALIVQSERTILLKVHSPKAEAVREALSEAML